MTEAFAFPRPWSIADHDGRISIVDRDGARVSEIMPGQHLGKIPSSAVCRKVAEGIVAAVNHNTIEALIAAPVTPAMVEAWKRAFRLEGDSFAQTASDEDQAAADFRAMLRAIAGHGEPIAEPRREVPA